MILIKSLLLAASIATATASPAITFPNLALPTNFDIPSITTPRGRAHAETVRTEEPVTALDFPIFGATTPVNSPASPTSNTPLYPNGAGTHVPGPNTAAQGQPGNQLSSPTGQSDSGGQHISPGQNNHGTSVYIAPDSGANGGLIVAGQPANAPIVSSTISLFTSAGTVYSTYAAVTPPPVLQSAQAGAVSLVPGSALTVGDKTYSLAPGGTAVYVNGVSSAVTGPAWVLTDIATWTTSGTVVLRNGTPITAGSVASNTGVSRTTPAPAASSKNAGDSLVLPAMFAIFITTGLAALGRL